ncbi:tRNA 2-thiouridine synthesizing protein E [Pasteurella skyensis]|uniref:Sulfurtransferase n=4 Tax=Pasteurellaceae TaxID=712 RepID=A0A1H7ZBF3_9PAST|nr:tRNA 2-thiouridine synthesizing protein E [Pasteurella skyensis]
MFIRLFGFYTMTNFIEFNQQQIPTDNEGYLKNLSDWSPELAETIAQNEELVLTDEHWEIINVVREFYQEYNTSPAIRMLVKTLANKFGQEKGNSRYLQRLFPNGPAKQATKIAGLPKPAKCL